MRASQNSNATGFSKRVLITAGIVIPVLLIIWLLGSIFELVLLLVAAVLVHALFMSFAQFIRKTTKIPMTGAKWASVLIILGVITAAIWLLAPHVSSQIRQLTSQLQVGFESAKNFLQQYGWGSLLLSQIESLNTYFQEHSYFTGFFTTTLGILVNIFVVLLLAAYFLVNPRPYAEGLVALFPKEKRDRIHETIHKVYRTLQLWLEGKLLSMLLVTVLTAAGLYILGFPLVIVLALIAGLLGFIPNFGPIIAAIPAILVAFTEGPHAVLYVILLYTGIQIVESLIFDPFVQKRMIYLPYAMILIAQVAFGLLVGILGVIFATPIVAALIVAVKMLYVHDVLNDENAKVGY